MKKKFILLDVERVTNIGTSADGTTKLEIRYAGRTASGRKRRETRIVRGVVTNRSFEPDSEGRVTIEYV